MVQSGVDDLERIRMLKRMLIDTIHTHRYTKVRDVADKLQDIDRTITINEIRHAIEMLEQENIIVAREQKPQYSFPSYLAKSYSSFPFWFVAIVTGLTLMMVYVIPTAEPWSTIRMVLGGAFVLYVPGYSLMQLFWPTRKMDIPERLAFAIGLSLALIPLIGLVLTQWSITLHSIIIALSLISVSVSIAGVYRKYYNAKK